MELSFGSPLPGLQNSPRRRNQTGQIEMQLRKAYRSAAAWLAERRVWAARRPLANGAAARAVESTLAEQLAAVQQEMLARTGMRVSIGVARSKTVARTASRLGPDNRICVVRAGTERRFLAPLSVQTLDGLPDTVCQVLRAAGIVTIGELQRVPKAALQAEFGRADGLRIWRNARGLDTAVDGERLDT